MKTKSFLAFALGWYFIVQGGTPEKPGAFQIMGEFLSYEQCQEKAKEVATGAKYLFVGTCWRAWPKEEKA